MHGVREIIQKATALPVEDRALVVDSLLRSLNTCSPEIDHAWVAVAQRRLEELRSGKVQAISGDKVLDDDTTLEMLLDKITPENIHQEVSSGDATGKV
jgi:hypothetical protein